jgi:Zinc dependent phospholipase C
MRRILVTTLLLLAFAGVPRPAAAWGFEAHKFIMARAIALLPPEIRPYFQKYEASIVEHAIDPDLWRTAGWLEEPPRHFVDMDAYGPYPFAEMPHVYDEAVKRYGAEFVLKNGTLPWRSEEIYGKLVEAFTQKAGYSRDNIRFFSSVLTHYVSDAHVPFHACLNYDGQLTGQSGIHSRFETELFERYRSTLTISPRPTGPVANAREFIFATLTASFPLVRPLLDADKAAIAGRDAYDDPYFTLFFSKARPILEQRLADSITDAASLITAAWVAAGRPALPLDVPRTPRTVRRPTP